MNKTKRVKTSAIAEFGDFQTPTRLAQGVCKLLAELGVEPASILEPTCGRGAFVFASADRWQSASAICGFDLNVSHLDAARALAASRTDASRLHIEPADFFKTDWSSALARLPEPILVIGNLPWVTNAHVSSLGGSNVPVKSNFQKREGFDAITGKANFDISEWMLIQLSDALSGREAVLAMLVKTAVARKLLHHCWKRGAALADANVFRIDASEHFDAAVEASLLVMKFGPGQVSTRAQIYGQLSRTIRPIATIGFSENTIISDLDAYERTKHLTGGSFLRWRSGVKHDCSKVMELQEERGGFQNGFGNTLELEREYLFPMLKSSEVAAGGKIHGTRWMVVPQCRIGASTAEIAVHAPKTWAYLQEHQRLLARRGSSIYRNRPDFSVFGVGDYTFTPWKVAISGMYKTLRFIKVGPSRGKPVVFDDTTNFLPCASAGSAELLVSMLNNNIAQTFYRAFVFWDSKRPITVELLGRLNLHALASELGCLAEFETHFGPARDLRGKKRGSRESVEPAPTLWPS